MDLTTPNIFSLLLNVDDDSRYCDLHPKLSKYNDLQCIGVFNSSIEVFILIFFIMVKMFVKSLRISSILYKLWRLKDQIQSKNKIDMIEKGDK